ncbi:hypothetical protein NEOLEDRAFT_1143496 [Neolentinus lepideus HHB14362 ss-1]|uniref:Uncharacterized protein n=1 Tax=Neolentinus lepideus HHB14362 ss-1 TaxID=1314782 RepID=A0A165MIH7_9AGAM|nr:hypothetical protein NEOLEDRAFT_1143496 [Neolentinus lepideus HHB14362 ss-1]
MDIHTVDPQPVIRAPAYRTGSIRCGGARCGGKMQSRVDRTNSGKSEEDLVWDQRDG